MKLSKISMIAALLFCASAVIAQDAAKEQAMPEMGAPPEIKEIGWLVGTWDVVMKSKWTPEDTAWITDKATATYAYVADGAAITMTYDGTASGMPFKGFMLQCYDRDTKMWKNAWTDNLGGDIFYSTGKKEQGKTVLYGDDIHEGQNLKMRITTSNETPTKFDWMMESSADGGKTYFTWATAVYTKRK